MDINLMIEHLIGGGLIMDLGILSREQNEVLETLKRSGLLNNVNIASIEDISLMKVIAIIQRGTKKDFIDLWTIMKEKKYSLKDIFIFCKTKYRKAFSESIALKALTYFQDAEEEETPEGIKYKFPWDDIKKDLITFTREYLNQYL